MALLMRYRLRTLLIVLALGPPLIAMAWWMLTSVQPERKVTDAELAFAIVATFVLTCIVACLLSGLLLAGVIALIHWLYAKFQRN
jgi:hypothetical protein